MSRKNREKKCKKRKRLRFSFIIFVFMYLLFRSVSNLFASTLKTTLAKRDYLEDKIQVDGIVIKNENVYRANGEGKISFYKKEGDRVGVGQKIGQLFLLNDNFALKEKLIDINRKIEILDDLDKNKDIFKNDKEKSMKKIDEIVKKVQEQVFDGDYEKANLLKDELYLYAEKQEILDDDKTLLAQSLKNLRDQKEKLLKEISEHEINYYSQQSGIVTFKVDGLEEVFSAKHILDYSAKDYKKIEQEIKNTKNGNILKPGEPICKIVDNFEWYLMVDLSKLKNSKDLKEGNSVIVHIDNGEERIKGKLIKIDKNKFKSIGIIKFNTFFHNYYDKRYVKVDLVKNKYEGLKIPTKAICEKDGLKGVYIKDISNIIKFRPVKVLGSDDEYTIVEEGNINHYIKLEEGDKPIRTITVHDEILLNTSRVKEGQIVN